MPFTRTAAGTISLVFLTLSLCVRAIASDSPGAPDQPTLRFIVTGDSRGSTHGVNEAIWAEIVQATLAESVSFILIPGDLVTGSPFADTLESQLRFWRDLTQPLYDAGIGVYPCRGNHDDGSLAAWHNVFSGPYALPANGPENEVNLTFAFTDANVFIIGLDQCLERYRLNQPWLQANLDTTTADHIFVFGHMPAFKVDHDGCLDNHADARDLFWNSLESAGVRAYFCGHDHFYDHARIADNDADSTDDLHQYIVGTAGAPLYDGGAYDGENGSWTPVGICFEKQHGYILVEIDGPTATLTWKHRTAPGVYEPAGDRWSYTVAAAALK